MDDLTRTEENILKHLLLYGDNVPSNVAEDIDASRSYVNDLLSGLSEKGLVIHKGNGVYKLSGTGISVAVEINKSEF
jgi:Mn-dependent DtxR family transcriptional regulator